MSSCSPQSLRTSGEWQNPGNHRHLIPRSQQRKRQTDRYKDKKTIDSGPPSQPTAPDAPEGLSEAANLLD
jgi:hypothetical protein